MNCHRAKELIDVRLHEGSDREATARGDWSELDAHLAGCPKCSADWAELQRTRALLAEVTVDRPEPEEVETMWQAIVTPGNAGGLTLIRNRSRWQFAAASVAVAAVLFLAFQLGQPRYRSALSGQMASLSHLLGIGTSCKVYDANSQEEWPAPPGFTAKRASAGELKALASRSGATFKRRKKMRRRGRPPVVGAYEWGGDVAAPDWIPAASGGIPVEQFVSPSDSGEVTAEAAPGYSFLTSGFQRVDNQSNADSDGDGVADMSLADAPPSDEKFAVVQTEMAPANAVRAAVENMIRKATPDRLAKVIKTGTLSIEVESYADAVERVTEIVAEHQASVANVSTREIHAGALAGTMVMRVSPARFDALFEALKAIGRVESENARVADVTADYVDLEARIGSLRITQARLVELITNKSFVDKMSALLEVEREMTRVRSQLEQLQGQLRVMADRVALSTITLTLHEPARTVPSGSLSVEVSVLEDAAAALSRELGRLGGRLVSGNTTKRGDGTLMGNYQLRISFARFAELLTSIENLGRVGQRQISDHEFTSAAAPWATKAQCNLGVALFERSRPPPAGSIRIEVEELAPALRQLDVALSSHDASIVSNNTRQQRDGSSTAELTLRVSGGRFAKLAEALKSLGRITARAITGEAGRIVGGAADVPCELSLSLAERLREVPSGNIVLEVADFENARRQLSKLVEEKNLHVLASSSAQRTDGSWNGTFRLGIVAGEMESVVSRLESLGHVVRRHVGGLGLGDLSRANPDAVGVVELTLAEKAALSPAPSRAGDSLRLHVRDGLAGLYHSLGLIAYGLIVMAPWLVIVVLLAWLMTRVWRGRQAVKTSSSSS